MSRPSLSRRVSSKPSPSPSQSRQSAGVVAASPQLNSQAPPLPRRSSSIAAAVSPALPEVPSTPTGAAALVSPRRMALNSDQTLPPFGTNGFLNFSTLGAYLFAIDDSTAVAASAFSSPSGGIAAAALAASTELTGAAAGELDARHRPLIVRALAQGVAPDVVFVQCVLVCTP